MKQDTTLAGLSALLLLAALLLTCAGGGGAVTGGPEFQVNTWTTDDQMAPSITSLSNGGFVVVSSIERQDGSAYGVYGRIFRQ